MWIELAHNNAALEVRGKLHGLGIWTDAHLDATGRTVGLVVQPSSKRVPTGDLLALPGVTAVHNTKSGTPLLDARAGQPVFVAAIAIGDGTPVLLAGPCAAESFEQVNAAAADAQRAGASFLRGGAFKPRTNPYDFAGHGAQALAWLRDAADSHGLGLVTEAMSELHADLVAEHADLIQIGSRNMQNYALLHAVGATGRPVLLKRGRAATVREWLGAGEHLLNAGAEGVIFCERGVRGFDPETRNLLDLGAAVLLRHVYQLPVVVDPSHAAGRRDLILPLCKASLAAGIDGLIVEAHPNSAQARSDAAQALSAAELMDVGRAVSDACARSMSAKTPAARSADVTKSSATRKDHEIGAGSSNRPVRI